MYPVRVPPGLGYVSPQAWAFLDPDDPQGRVDVREVLEDGVRLVRGEVGGREVPRGHGHGARADAAPARVILTSL